MQHRKDSPLLSRQLLAGIVILSYFQLGTTFIIREKGKEVGRWEENNGRNDTQYIDNDAVAEKPQAPSPEKSEASGKPAPGAPVPALPQNPKPAVPLTLLGAMKAVPFIRTMTSQGSTLLGSGVCINAHGVFLTNYHVVRNAAKIFVQLYDENYTGHGPPPREYEARVLRYNVYYDLAVLSAPFVTPNYFKFADPDQIQTGMPVIAIGNPSGLQVSTTRGIVSALRTNILLGVPYREEPGEPISEKKFENITWIQTDAPINPGNSGGPLLNEKMELIGVNTWGMAKSQSEGLNFASHVRHAIELAGAYQND